MKEHQICGTCRWGWHFEDQSIDPPFTLGECHRHAPTCGPYPEGTNYRTLWPVVHGSQGCGEWSSRFT